MIVALYSRVITWIPLFFGHMGMIINESNKFANSFYSHWNGFE